MIGIVNMEKMVDVVTRVTASFVFLSYRTENITVFAAVGVDADITRDARSIPLKPAA